AIGFRRERTGIAFAVEMVARHVDVEARREGDSAAALLRVGDTSRFVVLILLIIDERILNERLQLLRGVIAILRLALPFEIDAQVDVELSANYPRPDLRTKLVGSLKPCSDGVAAAFSKALDEKSGEVVPTIL